MNYLIFKSLHLVSMVAWFAGIFYLVRLFVYHTEAFDKPHNEKEILCQQYHIMESRLLKIICRPAMLLTWVFGLVMIYLNGWEWFKVNYWLHAKLFLVFLLSGYTDYNVKIIKSLKEEKRIMSSFQFRLYNEVPTLFLLSIVLLAVFKNILHFGYTFAGVMGFGLVLFAFAKVYRKIRLNN